jgi:hypothetical protein
VERLGNRPDICAERVRVDLPKVGYTRSKVLGNGVGVLAVPIAHDPTQNHLGVGTDRHEGPDASESFVNDLGVRDMSLFAPTSAVLTVSLQNQPCNSV